MSKAIVLKTDGLSQYTNVKSGYKYIGLDGDVLSEKSGSITTPIVPVDYSITPKKTASKFINGEYIYTLTVLQDDIKPYGGIIGYMRYVLSINVDLYYFVDIFNSHTYDTNTNKQLNYSTTALFCIK